MPPEDNEQSHGTHVAIGSGVAIFLIGAIFWAGATYNRVQGIEAQLSAIQSQISKLGDMQAVVVRQEDDQRRLDKLEEQVRQLR